MEIADKVAALEARVRELGAIVECIPLAAAGLGLIPLDQFTLAIRSPQEAKAILTKMAETAEQGVVLREHFRVPEQQLEDMILYRRRRTELEIMGVLMPCGIPKSVGTGAELKP